VDEMKCQFCDKILDKGDLGASTCQGCGDVFDQTQIVELRDNLNIEAYTPPEITVPVNKDDPLVAPESEQCVDCFADLMGADLESWRNGNACPYCGASNPDSGASSSIMDSESSDLSNFSDLPLHPFIVNSGPLMGKEIMLPIGVELGRRSLRDTLQDTGYQKLLSTISGEHMRLHAIEDGSIGVEDLGSKNGTYLNGDRVVGPLPRPMRYGDTLSLHDLCLTPSPPTSPFALFHHQQSGVSWKLPLTGIKQSVHLGRWTEAERRTPWYRMAQLHHAENHNQLNDLDAISRRHFFVDLALDGDGVSIQFWHELGKEPCDVQIGTVTAETGVHQTSTVLDEAVRRVIPFGTKVTVNMRKNTFVILTTE
jgi:hypothetical protein